jgi:hypothetical protein
MCYAADERPFGAEISVRKQVALPGRLEETPIHPLCTFTIPAIRPGGSTAEPTEAQRKAREWLPEAMLFPAVDANAPVDVGGEADSVEEMTDEN